MYLTSQKGSILIWSMILIVFITFSFIYVSQRISKSIDKNAQQIQEMNQVVLIDNIDSTKSTLDLDDTKVYQKTYIDSFHTALKRDEELHFNFSVHNTGSIRVKSGGPVYYRNPGLLSGGEGVLTGKINNMPIEGDLSIKNLGSFADISITFASETGITFPYNYYTIKENIGGVDIIKSRGEIR